MLKKSLKSETERKQLPLWILAGIISVSSRVILYLIFLVWQKNTLSDVGFFQALYQWDCGWYASIAQNGYRGEIAIHAENGQAAWAFFPLMPFLERVAEYATGYSLEISGVLLNSVFLFFLTWAAGAFAGMEGERTQQILLMLLINFGPYNVYYSTLYTETLFALLICLFLICMHQRRWIWMGICGLLASATRNLGVFLVFTVLVFCIQEYLHTVGRKNIFSFIRWIWEQPQLILGVCLIPLGLFSYMAYLGQLLGDPLAFVRVQIGWGGTENNPFSVLWNALSDIGGTSFYLAIWAVLALYLCCRQAFRRKPEAVASFIFTLIPLSARIVSIPRYVMCSFTILWELSDAVQGLGKLEKTFACLLLIVFGIITAQNWFAGNGIVA